jgi:hypothetical protein
MLEQQLFSKKIFSSNRRSKKLSTNNLSSSNTNQRKLIKLHRDGGKVQVPYDEYLALKKKNLESMEILKDRLIHTIKTKREKFIRQNAYDIELLKKICLERENEFRESVVFLQKDMRRNRNILVEDITNFYKGVLTMVKNIDNDVSDQVNARLKAIDRLIEINLDNCTYRHKKKLDKVINEQEDLINYFHMAIYQMKKIIDNFNIANRQIFEYSENIFMNKEKLLKEKIRHEYLKSLMKEYKMKINKIQNSKTNIDNIITTRNTKTVQNDSNRFVSSSIITSRQSKNCFNNLKNNIKNKSTNKRNDLLLTMDDLGNRCRQRPFSSGHRLTSSKIHNNSTKRTNYSNSNTMQSMFRVNSSRLMTMGVDRNSYTNLFDRRFNTIRNNVNSKILKKNKFSYFNSTQEIKENKSYTKSEINTINHIKNELRILKNKKKDILKKFEVNIPDNGLYISIKNILEKLRGNKDNLIVDGINNEYIKDNYMKVLPIQNKSFREKFLEILFNDKSIYEEIKSVTKTGNNSLFDFKFFGAKKINEISKK